MQKITFTKGQKNINEISLPALFTPAATDWIDKLGEKTFCVWLRFHAFCAYAEDGEDTIKIPKSLNSLALLLGVSKPTLQKHIKILWNYGLIELTEHTASQNPGTKPINVLVYDFPQNDIRKQTQPLEKVRDYDRDYQSDGKTYASKRGKTIKNRGGKENFTPGVKKILPLENGEKTGGKESFTPGVKKLLPPQKAREIGGKENFTGGVKKILPLNKDLKRDIKEILKRDINNNHQSFIELLNLYSARLEELNRLTDIQLFAISNLFQTSKLDAETFTDVLEKCLQAEQVYNFPAYVKAAVQNREQEQEQPKMPVRRNKPVRVEKLPEWFIDQETQPSDMPAPSQIEIGFTPEQLEQKIRMEEIQKKYKQRELEEKQAREASRILRGAM